MCVHLCEFMPHGFRYSRRPEESVRSFGAPVREHSERPDMDSENWLAPPEEQEVLLTAVLPVQSQFMCLVYEAFSTHLQV